MAGRDFDWDVEAKRLARSILDLAREQGDAWIPWGRVARVHGGSQATEERLRALAELPAYAEWFHSRGGSVALSKEGFRIAADYVPPVLDDVINAVTSYASQLAPLQVRVTHMTELGRTTGPRRYVYAAQVEVQDIVWPTEVPVTVLLPEKRRCSGKLVGYEADGSILYIVLSDKLEQAETARGLVVDRAYLLTMLADELRKLREFPRLALEFWARNTSARVIAHHNSKVVAEGLAALPVPWLRLLWGPPGGGKTYAMAHFVAKLLEQEPNARVLVVAPSNRAVDVFIDHLHSRLMCAGLGKLITERRILRYGYAKLPSVLERAELLGPPELDRLTQRVRSLARQLHQAKPGEVANPTMALLHADLLAAQEEVRHAVVSHLAQASVVATTTTLTYMRDSPIAACTWPTVIVDEVTMVFPALCVYLAAKAEQRFLLGGDPQQLGPIFENPECPQTSAVTYWMNQDVFRMAGLSSEGRPSTEDARLARITSQRRCAPEIWRQVESLYPHVTNKANLSLAGALCELPPCPGASVVLLDTSATGAQCEKHGRSWRCPQTADIAWEVATTIAAEARGTFDVAVIAPYRAQVRLMREWLEVEQRAEHSPLRDRTTVSIHTGTVHQFQGGQAGVVVFDLVDGPGRPYPGALLRGDVGRRLVNVAITRAVGKRIVVANKRWWEQIDLDSYNPLLKYLLFGSPPTPSRESVSDFRELPVRDAACPQLADRNGGCTESPIESRLLEAMQARKDLAEIKAQWRIHDEEGRIVSRADFAFPNVKLAIYCDGRKWHLREDCWQRDHRQRNQLTKLGWRFLVFTGKDIMQGAETCAEQVAETFHKLSEGRQP